MDKLDHKIASTPIPLSPEESEQASQLFGRSLFSAIQLAKEKEALRNRMLSSALSGDKDVLRIPIPASLMPSQKQASLSTPPYKAAPSPDEPVPEEGDVAHIKRNIGKYLGSYGGAATGASLGALGALRRNSTSRLGALKGGVKGGLAGGITGTLLGHLLDTQTKEKYAPIDADRQKREMLAGMLQSGELEKILSEDRFNKYAAEEDLDPYAHSSIIGRALQSHSNPVKLMASGQQGFADAKREHYMQEKALLQQELMKAQKEYIDLLSRIKTGEEKSTPNVDAFCNGIAHATLFGLDKNAKEDVNIEEGSAKRLLGEMLGVAKKPFQPAVDTAASGLLGTGAGMAYLTYLARKRMREQPESYLQEGLPTRVELEPY
jgi:hypothetical protein